MGDNSSLVIDGRGNSEQILKCTAEQLTKGAIILFNGRRELISQAPNNMTSEERGGEVEWPLRASYLGIMTCLGKGVVLVDGKGERTRDGEVIYERGYSVSGTFNIYGKDSSLLSGVGSLLRFFYSGDEGYAERSELLEGL